MRDNKKEMPLVYLLILNYKGYKDTCDCIASLREITYQNYRMLIIDNDSQDGSYEKLEADYPDIEMIQTGRNLGYAGGNNMGIEYAMAKGADYVGILNNDIKVEENFLEILIEAMEKDENIAIAGPAVCGWNQEDVQSAGCIINYYKAESGCLNAGKKYPEIDKEPVVCDYVTGACLLVRASVLKRIGLIPEVYFLYFEETEWCVRTKKLGYKVCCIPKARIWHKESASIGQNSDLKIYFQDRNRVVFEKRNADRMQFIICMIYIIMQTIYRCISKKHCTSGIGTVLDGLSDKISNEYNYGFIYDVEK